MIRAAIGRVLRWFLDAAPPRAAARVRMAPADRDAARVALAEIRAADGKLNPGSAGSA